MSDWRTMRTTLAHSLLVGVVLLQATTLPAPCDAAGTSQLRSMTRGAGALRDSGDFVTARDQFCVAVDLRLKAGQAPRTAADWIDSVGVTFLAFASDEALDAADSLLRVGLAIRRDDPTALLGDLATSLLNLSAIAEMRVAYSEGAEWARRAVGLLVASEDSSSRVLRATARNRLAHHLYRMDRFEQAIPELSLAERELLGAGGMMSDLFDSQNTLGECARASGLIAEAESSFERALATTGRMGPDGVESRFVVLNNLAGLYRDMEQFDRAEPLMRESLELRRSQVPPDPRSLATATLNLAEFLLLQDRPNEALPFYREATQLARGLGPADRAEVPCFLERAALCEWRSGNLLNARVGFEEAFERFARDSLPRNLLFAQAAQDHAEFLEAQSRTREAEVLAEEALRIREQLLGPHAPLLAEPLNLLARVALGHENGDVTRARMHAERSLSILDRAPLLPSARLDALMVLIDVAERSGDSAALDSTSSVAILAAEDLRGSRGGSRSRAHFLARVLPIYDRAFERECASARLAEAFRLHESSRARVLLDAFGTLDRRTDARTGESSLREARLRGALAEAQHRVEAFFGASEASGLVHEAGRASALRHRDSLGREYQREREARWMALPGWRESLSRARRAAGIDEIQRRVDSSREPALIYRVASTGSGVFVFLPGQRAPWFQRLQLGAEDAAVLGSSAGPLDDRRLTEFVSSSGGVFARPYSGGGARRGLSRVTAPHAVTTDESIEASRQHSLFRSIVPVAVWRRIQRARSVAIVADGPLAMLPFDALVVTEPRDASPTLTWLDAGPAIRVASSASVLVAIDERGPKLASGVYRALSVADVDYAGSAPDGRLIAGARGWPALPGTRLEADQLREAMGSGMVDTLIGGQASEARLRAALGGHGIVHIATHGFAGGEESDLFAGLVLARPVGATSAEDDGLLQLYEMMELRWDCALVVLSACETTAGHRLPGEGVMALARGVLSGGAERVIATLWSVDDEASAALVGALFRSLGPGLRAGRLVDVSIALRDAKRSVRAESRWRDPAYWAAFTLTGRR